MTPNPFIFGEIIDDENFVNRKTELTQLVRDLTDGQKVFLLSPANVEVTAEDKARIAERGFFNQS